MVLLICWLPVAVTRGNMVALFFTRVGRNCDLPQIIPTCALFATRPGPRRPSATRGQATLPPNRTWAGRRRHSWKPRNASRRTIPRLLGPLHENLLDRRVPHDLDAGGILQLRSDYRKYETRIRASFACDEHALVSPAASPEQIFRTHLPCVAPPSFCASMSPTEVKVTLIPPPGKAIKDKSPDALV